MGIVHSVHHLDAAAYARALRFVGTRDDITLAEVRPLLAELGRDSPERFEAASWDEVEDETFDDAAAQLRWLVVCAASSRASHCIDKANDRPAGGFRELCARERSLAPVTRLFESGDVPAECKGAESLVQVVAPADVARVAEAMQPWIGAEARARIAALSSSTLGRLFGPRDFEKHWRDDMYLWMHWSALADVVTSAARDGEPLAVTWG